MKKIAIAVLMLACTWPLPAQHVIIARRRVPHASSSPTYVGSAVASNNAGGTLTITYTPTAGNTLYYFAGNGLGTISALTDSTGTPTAIDTQTWNGTGQYQTFILTGVSGSSHSISATFSGAYASFTVVEVAHNSTFGSRSVSSIGSSNTNPIPCGSLTTSAGSIILPFSFVFDSGQTLSAGSGPPSFTLPTPTGTGYSFSGVGYSGVTTATTYTISSGFATTGGSGAAYFCYAIEAKP